MKPLAIDLFCGLGGWTEGLLAEGYEVVGFDIERHDYGDGMRYPAQLVLQDVCTIHGKQFKDAALIVASSPCQKYSYMAMPWKKAKDLARWYRDPAHPERLTELNDLFEQPLRIQREACEAAGRFIPMIQENVRGAIPWVGRSRWNFGSFHLWGDVPALMPMVQAHVKLGGGASWYPPTDPRHQPGLDFTRLAGQKVPGFRFDGSGKSFQSASVDGMKNTGGSWFNIGSPGQKVTNNNPARGNAIGEGRKNGGYWFNSAEPSEQRRHGSKSKSRKAASAAIAKIPLPLARHIAWVWHPQRLAA